MFSMANCLRERAQHKGSLPTKTVRVTALLGAFVFVSVAVNALTIFADSNLRQRSLAAADCSAVMEPTDRLACYDKVTRPPVSHPSRGANAPALTGSL